MTTTSRPLKVAMAGFGTVGRSVARILCEGHHPALRLVAVCTRRPANVIPDLAEAEVDARVVLPDDMNVVDLAVRDIVERTEVAGTTSELWGGFGAFPMAKTPAVEYLVTPARGVARKLSIDLVDVLTGGVSDGNKIAQLGTPVLDGLGPIGGLDHSPDDYVVLESVVPRTALLAGLIREICRHRAELRGVA